MCVCVWERVSERMYMKRECVCVYMYIFKRVCICAHACVCARACVCVCAGIYMTFSLITFWKFWFNRHQGMWMATREQVYHLDERCNSQFFNINEETAVWVEVGFKGGRGRNCRQSKYLIISHASLHAHTFIRIMIRMTRQFWSGALQVSSARKGGRERERWPCSLAYFSSLFAHIRTRPPPKLNSSGWTAKE